VAVSKDGLQYRFVIPGTMQDRPLGNYPTRATGTSWRDRRLRASVCFEPDPFGDAELHSAAECFIAQMRICNLRVRIMRDGHEPNEAEEQRPCCVPIEPVHVISSPKDRPEQVIRIQVRLAKMVGLICRSCQSTIFRSRGYRRETWSRARILHCGDRRTASSISANTGAPGRNLACAPGRYLALRDATVTWATVRLLRATRDRDRRARCPASRGGRQIS
jgi:hypothetical protein